MRDKDRRFPLTLALSPVGGEGIVGYVVLILCFIN